MGEETFILEVVDHATGDVIGTDIGDRNCLAADLPDILGYLPENHGIIINRKGEQAEVPDLPEVSVGD